MTFETVFQTVKEIFMKADVSKVDEHFSLTSQDKAKASFMRKQRTAGFMWSLTNTMTGMQFSSALRTHC